MNLHHRFPVATITAIVTMLACSLSRPTTAQENGGPIGRVRSSDAAIIRLIEQAITRSPAFKRLIATVEASNGIVYVEPGVCPGALRACLPVWMVTSGSTRFLRIVVDRHRLDADWKVISMMAHELVHATEALSEPSVTDSTKMFFFLERFAPTGRDAFETGAAVQAGIVVGKELRAWRQESASGDAQTVPNSSGVWLLATSVTRAN